MTPASSAEKRGPDVFTVTAGVVGPQAAEQVLVALADAGYVVRADGVPAPDTAAPKGPMRRRSAHIILRGILRATADGEDFDRCAKEATALLDIVATRGLTDAD